VKKLYSVGLLLCALLLAYPAAAKEAPKAKAAPKGALAKGKTPAPGVLARVGSDVITEQEVEEVMDRSGGRSRSPEAKQRVLQDLVEIRVFAQEGKKAGLLNDPEVKARLKEAQTLILARAYYTRQVVDKAEVSDEVARQAYEKHKEGYQSPEQIEVAHILVKEKEKADEIAGRLGKGESF